MPVHSSIVISILCGAPTATTTGAALLPHLSLQTLSTALDQLQGRLSSTGFKDQADAVAQGRQNVTGKVHEAAEAVASFVKVRSAILGYLMADVAVGLSARASSSVGVARCHAATRLGWFSIARVLWRVVTSKLSCYWTCLMQMCRPMLRALYCVCHLLCTVLLVTWCGCVYCTACHLVCVFDCLSPGVCTALVLTWYVYCIA
jgi:hypothetical protein